MMIQAAVKTWLLSGPSRGLALLALLTSLASCTGGDGGGAGGGETTPSAPPEEPAEEITAEPVHLPPLAFAPSVDQETIYVGGAVACSGEAVSPSGVEITYLYSWHVSDRPGGEYKAIGGETSSVLVASAEVAHRFVRCRMKAVDSKGAEKDSELSDTVAIGNTAPREFTPTTDRDKVLSGQTLKCTARTVDVDGDDIAYSIAWRLVDNPADRKQVEELPITDSEISIVGEYVNSYLICEVTATDGLSRAMVVEAAPVKVENLLPDAFFATLTPTRPKVGQRVACSGSTLDGDGDGLSYSYSWHQSEFEVGPWTAVEDATDPFLDVNAAIAHRFLRCDIKATDIHGDSTTSDPMQVGFVENTSPADFSAYFTFDEGIVGETLECRGMARDADLDALSYDYRWYISSTADGTFTQIPSQQYRTFKITPAQRRKFLRCDAIARDGFGGETVSSPSQAFRVKNSAPKIFATILQPESLYIYDLLTCTGQTTDIDADDLLYSLKWFEADSYTGPFRELSIVANELAIDLTRKHKYYRCQITANDLAGGVTVGDLSIVSTVLNTAPENFGADVSVTEAKVGDDIVCSGATTDKDADALSYTTEWLLADEPHETFVKTADYSGATLRVDHRISHRYARCRVVADDGYQGRTVSSESAVVKIINTAPEAFVASTSAPEVDMGGTIACGGDTTDADHDVLSYSYRWLTSASSGGVFQVLVGQASSTLTITPALKRHEIKCQRIADDAHGGVTESDLSSITRVRNTTPDPFEATVPVATAKMGDIIVCGGETTDRDLDALAYTYRWYSAEGQYDQYDVIPTATGKSLVASSIVAHKWVRCEVIANDNFVDGIRVSTPSSSVEMLNTAPAAFGVTPSQTGVLVSQSVTCNGGTVDVDADNLVYEYEWFVAETENGTYERDFGAASKTFPVTYVQAHRWLKCRMVASDGYDGRTESSLSAAVKVNNTRPFDFPSTASPSSVTVNQDIACSGSTTDIDNDDVSITKYNWYSTADNGANYALIAGQTAATFKATNTYRHLKFACEVVVSDTPWDGITTSSKSPLVTYANTLPTTSGFVATTNAATQAPINSRVIGQTITCSGTTTDVDDDPLSYSTEWFVRDVPGGFVDGIAVSSTGDTVTLNKNTHAHKYVACRRVANDGRGSVKSAFSAVVTVANTQPVWNAVPNQSIAENSTLTVTLSATDADGDPVTFSCSNCTGASVSGTSFTYTPPYNVATRQATTAVRAFTVSVTDGLSAGVTDSFDVTVSNVDRSPTGLTVTCPASVNENASLVITYAYTDPDGDAVAVAYSSGGTTSNPSHDIANKRFTFAGSHDHVSHTGAAPWKRMVDPSFTFTYADPGTPSFSQTVSCPSDVQINDVNRAGSFAMSQCDAVNENSTHYFYYTWSDPDGDSISVAHQAGSPPESLTKGCCGNYFYMSTSYSTVPHSSSYRSGSTWVRGFTLTFRATESGTGTLYDASCSGAVYDVDRAPSGSSTFRYGHSTMSSSASYIMDNGVHCYNLSLPSKPSFTDPDGDTVDATEIGQRECSTYAYATSARTEYSTYSRYMMSADHRQPIRGRANGVWSGWVYGYKDNCYNVNYLYNNQRLDWNLARSTACDYLSYYWHHWGNYYYNKWEW